MKPQEIEKAKQTQIQLLYDASSEADKAKLAKYLHTEQEIDYVDAER